MKSKLSSSVSIVKLDNNVVEFFKTNTRQQIRVKSEGYQLADIAMSLDGIQTNEEISQKYNLTTESLKTFIHFLETKGLLDATYPEDDFKEYDKYRRIINFLQDYSENHSDLVTMWNNIIESKVLIIGLGAVGSWVAVNLIESGVKNITLMDDDIVDQTNLHRQYGFSESDVGQFKTKALKKELLKMNSSAEIECLEKKMEEGVLEKELEGHFNLIINCADMPNVDTTSKWVGEYCMKHEIPHIVGGGYNLHSSLIGQTVLPNKSACVKCFELTLNEENTIDKSRVRKLGVKNRKIGSFGPMCSMIASFIGMEAIKVLTNKIEPANLNRRGEFDIVTMNIEYKNFPKREDCDWCGNKS